MARMSRDDVVDVLGRVDDLTVAEIIATGASREDLAEAQAWVTDDQALIAHGKLVAVGQVVRLVEILACRQEDEEALLESRQP